MFSKVRRDRDRDRDGTGGPAPQGSSAPLPAAAPPASGGCWLPPSLRPALRPSGAGQRRGGFGRGAAALGPAVSAGRAGGGSAAAAPRGAASRSPRAGPGAGPPLAGQRRAASRAGTGNGARCFGRAARPLKLPRSPSNAGVTRICRLPCACVCELN